MSRGEGGMFEWSGGMLVSGGLVLMGWTCVRFSWVLWVPRCELKP